MSHAMQDHPGQMDDRQSTSCKMLSWMTHKRESRLLGEIPTTSDMQKTPPIWTQRWTKEPLDESERGEWKSWLETQHSKNRDHGFWSYHFMSNRWGKCGNSVRWAPISMWTVTAAMKLKDTCSLNKSYDKPRQCIKKQTHHFADKDPYSQSYGFCRSHVWMWE